ncbi:tRNA adenosine(34) deaminase TadA [Apilactobacillus xinyiensis]|uniref:tRNA-specific adenosine deaminase n=1 Tax=Apilactobacillus xinyiensis TaxID=2841032 RepID=A0ABT0I2S1_9LACO|nr:tRNA adenosine(34) deaminase TadA [Apilactobacillus xinyiensis]MCK8625029.1 tRNA adenosine(34) deaminase TadA [Apilactobacillus xinyiensis]MCL0330310.1 tRNA adenosine(34) deaminase TadA [Apilactobacillus xinyiensis]
MTFSKFDYNCMQQALFEAQKAYAIGEVPIGAVITKDNEIIATGFNLREHSQTAIDHAEVIAINQACNHLNSWRLEDCTLYVTIEPCLMCAGAILNSRVKRVVYGAPDLKAGGVHSLYNVLNDKRLNHQVIVESGLMDAEAANTMKSFFRAARKRNKKRSKH